MRMTRSWSRWVQGLSALFSSVAASAALAQTGTVAVRVIEPGGAGIAQAQTAIVNTTIGGLTGLDGRVMLRGVPAGTQTVRVLRVGFAEQKKTVEVPAGGNIGVEFTMSAVAVSLTPVVTTATGETRRVEIGNAVSSFTVADITEKAPISNVQDVINARTPGVSVQLGTQTGTGARIRIRGANSLSLSNEPIWIIDGVRMTSDMGAGPGTGGNATSRTNDLNPDEIESIEIVKGPSAATLYGTDAANGVIVVTTKKGRAGATRWSATGEGGILADRNTYPHNYTIAGHLPGQTAYTNCLGLVSISTGGTNPATCVMDSVRIYSPFFDPDATPISQGDMSQYSVQALGGTDQVRYFVSADQSKETGVLRLPPFERRRINAEGAGFHPWVERPNMLAKYSFRTNLQTAFSQNLDAQFQVAYINLYQRFTQESNATVGLGSQAFGGPGYKNNGTIATVNTPLNGYRAWTPGYTWQERTDQTLHRLMMSTNLNWRPTSWLQNRVNIGTDLSDAVDGRFLFRGEGAPISATNRNGFSNATRDNTRTTTADLGSTATWAMNSWVVSKTTAGVQYTNYQSDNHSANGSELPPGSQVPDGALTRSASASTTVRKTLGLFVEEAIALNDRLFLTGAVRSDQNSAFGTNFQNALYPKVSASWLISDEPMWKAPGFVNSARLRVAYGTSGVQPGPNDALRNYATVTTNIRNVESAGEVFSAIGNQDLRPEQSAEIEGGFETKMFDNRWSLDLTYYRKKTKDALISAIVPPSLGSAASVRKNLGEVRNSGIEILINGQIIDRPNFAFDITINASKNANVLKSLGGTPPQIGTTTRAYENYPLFGLWAQPITAWNDANGDKIITPNEQTVGRRCTQEMVDAGPGTATSPGFKCASVGGLDTSSVFRGYSAPRQFLSVTPGFDLLRKRLRVQALLDYRGGNSYYNNTERIRCVSRQNCNGFMNPKSDFEEQAMVVGTLNDPTRTLDGFFQSGDFVKLREVSVSWDLPASWAAQMKSKSARLSLSGRNLWKHTLYKGVDPENDFTITGSAQNVPQDFQTIGGPSYVTARLSINW
jgi:TonB-linked SusC/RagA family outer membrane protein